MLLKSIEGRVSLREILRSIIDISFRLTVVLATSALLFGTVRFSKLTSPPSILSFSDKLGMRLEEALVELEPEVF
jgi:hypothetical protein